MNPLLHLLQLLWAESTLVECALLLLILGLFKKTAQNRCLLAGVALLGCLTAGVALFWTPTGEPFMNGMVVFDPITRLFKLVILVLSGVTVVFARESRVREHFAEYLALILFATVGMLLMVGTEELLVAFLALELTSISLYILAAFQRTRASAEAALKYFLAGSVAAAFLLFGLSLIYGVAGTTNLHSLLASISGKTDPLLLAGMVFVLVGFGFKVAAVPFHLWAPDVYQGAPTPSAALIASGSKVAGFFLLIKMLVFGLGGTPGSAMWAQGMPGWVPLVAFLAIASILLGNLAALAQTNVKRLLAWSAIAHSGYMLLGLTASDSAIVFFYVITYALTTLGAFGVVAWVEEKRGGSELHHFTGLSRTAPGLAFCLLLFLISLAGIPPMVGFFGKFYLFAEILRATTGRMLWLVIPAIALNAVSLYYYLRVLKHAFVLQPEGELPPRSPVTPAKVLIGLLALAILLLGLYPDILLNLICTVFHP